MQVSTGNLYPSVKVAAAAGVPDGDLIELRGTLAQVESISRAVKRQHADDAKRKARRQTQASRRRNR